jgi:Xaa-Pro aminopeptidase
MVQKRVKKIWQLIGHKPDGLLITSPENVRYLSGFSGTEGTLIFTRREGFFLTDGRYTIQAKDQVKDFTVITFKEKWKEIGRLIKKLKISFLGFESRQLTTVCLRDLEKESPAVVCLPYADELDALRCIKNPREVALLKHAAAIAAESLLEVIPFIMPGVRETDIAAELEYRIRKKGGDGAAFQTIIASGSRSALPHGVASEKKIMHGEFLIIDYGVVYKGYCSDETCTFVVGMPTTKQKHIYAIVKKAHDVSVAAVKPGVPLTAIDAAARRYIEKQGYGKYFNHGTGHGIGLCVHEAPVVSFRSKATAQKGMVFTIEPGIYIPAWGGVRIEDTVVVTEKGWERITLSDKNLRCINM